MNFGTEDDIYNYLDISEYELVTFYNQLFDDEDRRHMSIYPETIYVQFHNIEKNMSIQSNSVLKANEYFILVSNVFNRNTNTYRKLINLCYLKKSDGSDDNQIILCYEFRFGNIDNGNIIQDNTLFLISQKF